MTKSDLIFFGYERRSKVDFIGNGNHKPVKDAYIWAILKYEGYNVAYIGHPDGLLKSEFEAKAPFASWIDNGSGKVGVIDDIYFDNEVKFIEVTEDEIILSDIEEREKRNNKAKSEIDSLLSNSMFYGFKRGSKVDFFGNDNYKPYENTYIWAFNFHEMPVAYIQHPEGELFVVGSMGDGFESPHSSSFDPTMKYIQVSADEIILSDQKEREDREAEIKELVTELILKIKK